MLCYNCGCQLSEKPYCTSCGADVILYKKIMSVANYYYNDGLAKAQVRDLSGAMVSLRQALKFNKNHVEARNLLGLVYYEVGETVSALSEWVLSINIRPQKNLAQDYIEDMESNPTQKETFSQTIKKYNQALAYCYSDSNDLAILQLKKVTSLNPRFVKAHQLLALLYLEQEEWDKAIKVLERIQKVDINNTTTLRFMQQATMMHGVDEKPMEVKRRINVVSEDAVRFQSGNEDIIIPKTTKNPIVSSNAVLNVIVGIAIGMAVCFFLVLPARIQNAQSSLNDELKTISDNSDAKTVTITELEQRVDSLTDENQSLQAQLAEYTGEGGALQSVDGLLTAVNTYLTEDYDIDLLTEQLYEIDTTYVETESSDAYRVLYQTMMAVVGPDISKACFVEGSAFKNDGDLSSAIIALEKAWFFDQSDAQVLYTLANAYQEYGENDRANELYSQLIALFPDSTYAKQAEQDIADATTSSVASSTDDAETTETTTYPID